ncbi:hypothetical protein [Streptomyces sp. TRM68416]|uniref:hypothetical protein n=1 Tax=Streptomyces sp. TRM68416 TaxID=2758412 RepID=UPI00397FCA00
MLMRRDGDSGPNGEEFAALRPDLITAVRSEAARAAHDGFCTKPSPERIDRVDGDRVFVLTDKISYLRDSEAPAVGAALAIDACVRSAGQG